MQDAAAIQEAAEALATLGILGIFSFAIVTFAWWLGVAILTGFVADYKGFSRGWWFVLGLVFGPFGLLGAAGLPDRRPESRAS